MPTDQERKNEELVESHGRIDDLKYDPNAGSFKWRRGVGGFGQPNVRADKRAGKHVYVDFNVQARKVRISAPRAAWRAMKNEWPDSDVQHINGNSHDNRWENLTLKSESATTEDSKDE